MGCDARDRPGGALAFAASDSSAYPEGSAVPHSYVINASGGQPRSVADMSGDLTDWVHV